MTLTVVPGLRVGHSEVEGGGSGCTVVLGPFRAAVEVTGMATGTRELGVLDPRHLAPRVDAIVLTGGSAFGLAAAEGVAAWLGEQGRGFETGVGPVPLVPAAVIFDLIHGVGRPDGVTGRRACEGAAEGAVPEGLVGAGAGARVGKLAGPARSSRGGLGSTGERLHGYALGALAVVNALGNVTDGEGRVVAGAKGDGDEAWLDLVASLRAGPPAGGPPGGPVGNTTLGIVATDAPLSRTDLARVARMAATALPRRIDPVNTPFDGDLVFALSTASSTSEMPPADVLALGVALRVLLEESITRAVTIGR